MKELIIKALQYAVDNEIVCNVRSTNKMFDTYHELNGQRQCKILNNGFFNDKQKDKDMFPECFTIVRHCTFENKGDENKENAVIMDIYPSKLTNDDKVRIWNNGFEFGGFEFIFHKDLQY
jgi:hypothetical protein